MITVGYNNNIMPSDKQTLRGNPNAMCFHKLSKLIEVKSMPSDMTLCLKMPFLHMQTFLRLITDIEETYIL